jgi:hypothetical protein
MTRVKKTMATLMALALLVALTAVTGLPAFAWDKDRKCCSTFSQKQTNYQSGTNYSKGDYNNQSNVLLSAQQQNATSGGDIKDNDVANDWTVKVDQD